MFRIRKVGMATFVLLGLSSGVLAQPEAAKGNFTVFSMAHTPGWPSSANLKPWDGKSNGTFIYASASCSASNAPINNASSDLPSYNTRIPASRVPSSTRAHNLGMTMENGQISGTVDLTVCQLAPGPTSDDLEDAARDKIFLKFTASPNTISS
jgi:hypothetical protein